MNARNGSVCAWVGCALLGALAGCGDSAPATTTSGDLSLAALDLAAVDLAPAIDLAPPADLAASSGIGMECPVGNECAPGFICLSSKLDPSLPPIGYCDKVCVNDPDCGAGAFCGPTFPGVGKLCWLRCGPGDSCADSKHVCGRYFNGFLDLVNSACLPGTAGAEEGTLCKTFQDCNKNQYCVNNPFEAPGGFCATINCKIGDPSTCVAGNNAQCIRIGATNIGACLPGCATDADCRSAEGYQCATGGLNIPKLCQYIHGPPGAACAADRDCDSHAQSAWKCLTGMMFPGGYCGGYDCDPRIANTCPTNMHCVTQRGRNFCAQDCVANDSCRTKEGYTCSTFDPQNLSLRVCLF